MNWNSDPLGVHAIFEAQAASRPLGIAAIDGAEQITYAELDAWSAQVARVLASTGAETNGPVAVLCDRSFSLLAAVLGVLRAGGAVVPLDPDLPRARIATILEDTGAPVLASADLAARYELREVIPIPARSEPRDGALLDPLDRSAAGGERLAYILYTSGSTGRPKGISFPHAALLNLIRWHRQTMVPASRVLQFASIGFDASFHEIFAAWSYGGALVLIGDEVRKDPVALGKFIHAHGVEKVILPVVVLQELAEAYVRSPRTLERLREVTTTGEAMHLTPRVIELFRRLPQCTLHNHYGPTESHVVTAFTLTGDPLSWPARPPIGRVIANVRVLVLGPQLERCRVGEIGELYIGGACLARGYWRRPELTAERFIVDPFASDHDDLSARLYRTGDLGRMDADGVIEYLGRSDRQIKLKGVRVELGEIEAALGALDGVRGVAVEHRDARLYAYVTLRCELPSTAEARRQRGLALRDELRRTLPEAMIPAELTLLKDLPLTVNGKIDRTALAERATLTGQGRATQPGARSTLEGTVLEVWRDSLRLDAIGVDDTFLALGGDSLAAARLIARTRRIFGVELNYREVLTGLTAAELTARVRAARSDGEEATRSQPQRSTSAPSSRDRAPLTFAQERLWFLRKLAPQSRVYHLRHAFRLRGPIDTDRIVTALAAILDRHPALRTAIVERKGRAEQRIMAPSPQAIQRLTVSSLASADREAEISERLTAELARPFDLEGGVPARLGVLRFAADDHLIWLHLHHIIADGWSEALLLAELGDELSLTDVGDHTMVRSARGGQSYVDYAAEQRSAEQQTLMRAREAEAIALARERLADAPALLRLPWDRPRPALQRPDSAAHELRLDASVTASLRELARTAGATTPMVLLTAWVALLHRYTGVQTLTVGLPSAGRGREELEGTVGLFVNILVVPVDIAAEDDFSALLATVRERCLEAFERDFLPFERLVSALKPPRDPSYNPLVQVGFAPQPEGSRTLEIAGIEAETIERGGPFSPFDLTLYVWEEADTIDLAISFDQDLFDRATAERMEGHLRRMLAAAVDERTRPLADLPLLSPAEREQALYTWNESSASDERRISSDVVHGLVERVAQDAPRQRAAVQGDETLDYRQLDRRANALAHALHRRGIGRGDRVAIAVDRSFDLLVGVLGILKSGAAFVPVDPAYPEARRSWMIRDSEAALLITQRHLAPSPTVDTPLLLLGDESPGADAPPPVAHLPEDCAYMIYTSGSTGTPKGVMLAHRGAVNLARAQLEMCRLSHESVVLQFSSLSFDAFVFELLAAWGVGATICLPPPGPVIPGAELVELLRAHRVSYWVAPPSVLSAVPEATLPELAVIVAAGERCTAAVVDRWGPGRIFINAYGPTEVTVCATFTRCRPGAAEPTIGRPLRGVQVYVLDGRGSPTAIGVPGEIVIGGPGVALGYHRRPEETAAKFIVDPFSGVTGARLYRSGDRGRRRPNGEIEFLGRDDDQVKLRGFRIELGEIEAALRRAPEVVDAVVTASPRLTGHVLLKASVAAGDHAHMCRRLQAHLGDELPAHMVPPSLVIHDSFPTLANGKVDRRSLAASHGPGPRPQIGVASPTAENSPIEGTLAAIWGDVLGLDAIDHEASFFDVGGDSLALAQVQAEIADRLGRTVKIVDLFRFTTIRALALHLAGRSDRRGGPSAAPEPGDEAKRRRGRGEDGAIAIVGVAGRFPGAADVEALWTNLLAGVDSIHTSTPDELVAAGVDPEMIRSPRLIPRYGLIDGAYDFDAGFFGYSPQESRLIDPQHRVFLESAFAALEDAAYDPSRRGRSVGVFGGSEGPYHWLEEIGRRGAPQSPTELQIGVANIADNLTARVAYKLGLEGPAVTVLAACATSLVAVHVGCQSLRDGECDLALAGGSAIAPPSHRAHLADGSGLMSDDGRCCPFDASASGTVGASGVAIVALRRLRDALDDGDRIYAVIRGSAVGHDGGAKIGFTAPSPRGQERALNAAYAASNMSPETVGYVEAHGTGTRLGDPIEVAALTAAFRRYTAERGFCALGSLKGNLGHTGAAAGVAGLIKAALIVDRGEIPPTVHYTAPNPALELESSPFFINAAPLPWPDRGVPRRAAVSAFGVGGTNAHVIIERAAPLAPASTPREWQALLLSARSERALSERSADLAAHLRGSTDVALADAAYTIRRRPSLAPARRVVVCRERAEAAAALARPRRQIARAAAISDPRVVWMFPGGGTQYVGMGRQLYAREPVFRAALDRCAERMLGPLGVDIRRSIFAEEDETEAAARLLLTPSRNTAAIFAIEHALAQLLLAGGQRPHAVFGQSLGEYAAAVVAEVMSLDDAIELIVLRGLLCDACPPAAMLSVSAGIEAVRHRLGEQLSVAAINGPALCVIAGHEEPLRELAAALAAEGVASRSLAVAGAAHSIAVDPVVPHLVERARKLDLRPPQIPLFSCVVGGEIGDRCAEAEHWGDHLRRTIRFTEASQAILGDPQRVFLEVGPSGRMSSLLRRQPGAEGRVITSAMAHPQAKRDESEALYTALGELWCAGVNLDERLFSAGELRRVVSLPSYPFERSTYTVDGGGSRSRVADNPQLEQTPAVDPSIEDPTVRAVAEIWAKILGVRPIAEDDDFFALGGSSLTAIELRAAIHDRLGAAVPVHALIEHPSLGAFARSIDAPSAAVERPGSTRPASPQVGPTPPTLDLHVILRQGPAESPPLFLIQPIGGTVFAYRALAQAFEDELAVVGLRAPGLEDDEPIVDALPALVDLYYEQIQARQPRGAILLGGHSSGGLLALAVAERFVADGRRTTLIALDTGFLSPLPAAAPYAAEDLLRELTVFQGKAANAYARLEATLTSGGRLGQVMVATRRALAAFDPQQVDVELHYFLAAERVLDDADRLTLRWLDLAGGGFSLDRCPGDHFSMLEAPHVRQLARRIGRRLSATHRGTP